MALDESTLEPVAPPASVPPPSENGGGTPPPADEWQGPDKNGKQWVPRKDGKSGRIIRQGDETVAAARERAAKPKDSRPKRKPKQMKKEEPATKPDLKALEAVLADVFRQPAMLAAAFGDEWGTRHFELNGPVLARNLVSSAEHSPWLRRKLEEMAAGGAAGMQILIFVPVLGSIVGYVLPPLVYYLNLPFPEQGRLMLGIPARKEERPPYAARPASPPPAEPPQAAAA